MLIFNKFSLFFFCIDNAQCYLSKNVVCALNLCSYLQFLVLIALLHVQFKSWQVYVLCCELSVLSEFQCEDQIDDAL
jgi:hypothetical protein